MTQNVIKNKIMGLMHDETEQHTAAFAEYLKNRDKSKESICHKTGLVRLYNEYGELLIRFIEKDGNFELREMSSEMLKTRPDIEDFFHIAR